jgi:hypothetical protein
MKIRSQKARFRAGPGYASNASAGEESLILEPESRGKHFRARPFWGGVFFFMSVARPHTPCGVSESNPVAARAPVGTVKSVFRTRLQKCGGKSA